MNANNWKSVLLPLLMLCAIPFAAAQSAVADQSVDDNVNTVQSHFHFKDPVTGQDIAHDKLKTVLLHPLGPSFTELDEGIVLSTQMDERTKFGANHYFQFAPDLKTMLLSALHLPDIGDLAGQLQDEVIDKCLDYDYFYAAGALEAWELYATETATWDLINAFVETFEISLIDELVRDYIAFVADPDDDSEQWTDLEYEWGPIQQRNDFHIDLHEYCRTIFRANQGLNHLQPDLDKFTDQVNQLIKGNVNFGFAPDRYALYAPANVAIDASGSTGTDGSNIASYHWIVDGNDGGTASTYNYIYWTPGQHTIQCIVVDENGATLTGNDVFTVSTPPLSVHIINRDNRTTTISTPINNLVNTYLIDFGDGSQPYTLDNSDQSYTLANISIPHQFPDNKQYTLTLTEKAQNGSTIIATSTVNLSPVPTDVYGGTLTISQTWGLSASPYRIHGSLYIPQGVRLTLQPGVILQFDAGYSSYGYSGVVVGGALISQGQYSSTKEVYLTSANDNSPPPLFGKDNGYADDWQGIQLVPGGSVTLTGAYIRHASTGVSATGTGLGSSYVLSGGTFDRCGYGIRVAHSGLLTVSGDSFLDCFEGVLEDSAGNGPVTLTGNSFNNTLGYGDTRYYGSDGGLAVLGSGQDVSTSGNSFAGAALANFHGTFGVLSFHGDSEAGGGRASFDINGVTLTKDNTWTAQAGIRQRSSGGNYGNTSLTVAAGVTLTLEAGAVIQFSNSTLFVQGDLRGPSSGGPAYLTSTSDDTPYGGADGGPSAHDAWQGVVYNTGLTANLQTISICHANVGLSADTANLNGCSFISNGSGVVVAKGGGVYRNSTFTGNGIAVQNNSTNVVDARGNDWGDPSGPYNAHNNPNGRGNPVSDYVLIGDASSRSITGKVTLQGCASMAQPLVFTLTPTGSTGGSATTQTLTPAADGTFTLGSVPAGTYTLGVKGAKWLRKDVTVDTTGGSITLPTVPLLGGDLDGNNQVDFGDFLILRAGYNAIGTNLPADIDCNGQVDFGDFLILRANYNAVGDP